MKKLIIFIFVTIVYISAHAFEEDHYDSLFTQGNSAYQEQNFEAALSNYLLILESGLESADLFYNTGNCYYKLNQPTQAILYYEKGLKLRPLSKDIKYNLGLANKQIVDKIEALPIPFYKEWWNVLINSLSVDAFAIISVASLTMAVVLLLLFFRTGNGMIKRLSFFLMVVMLIGSIITYVFANAQYTRNTNNEEAIIFSGRVNIYSEPNTTSTTLFIVHDGLKVTILKTENQWNQIKLPDGSIGWIPQEALVQI